MAAKVRLTSLAGTRTLSIRDTAVAAHVQCWKIRSSEKAAGVAVSLATATRVADSAGSTVATIGVVHLS